MGLRWDEVRRVEDGVHDEEARKTLQAMVGERGKGGKQSGLRGTGQKNSESDLRVRTGFSPVEIGADFSFWKLWLVRLRKFL